MKILLCVFRENLEFVICENLDTLCAELSVGNLCYVSFVEILLFVFRENLVCCAELFVKILCHRRYRENLVGHAVIATTLFWVARICCENLVFIFRENLVRRIPHVFVNILLLRCGAGTSVAKKKSFV